MSYFDLLDERPANPEIGLLVCWSTSKPANTPQPSNPPSQQTPDRTRGLRRALSVDHNHHTGAVRGLLCDPCNRIVIGRYDVNALTRAIAYLYDPPAPHALGYTITVPTNTNTLCAHNGGQGIGAGHTCRCNRETGHPHDSDRPHGCECGALWADQP